MGQICVGHHLLRWHRQRQGVEPIPKKAPCVNSQRFGLQSGLETKQLCFPRDGPGARKASDWEPAAEGLSLVSWE